MVFNNTILKELSWNRPEGFHYAISSSQEILKVFDYVTTHSSIEWAIGSYINENNEKSIALIAGNSSHSVYPISSINEINEASVLSNIHTHISPIQDIGASGYMPPTKIPNDRYNVTNLEKRMKDMGKPTPKHYVYDVPNGVIYEYNSRKGDIYSGRYSIKLLKRLLKL
ncbi:MAG: hypothetical protein IJ651_08795 [Bacteroidales bacterium]|nr:hypothetical protein [Bacteroidales bacterium]